MALPLISIISRITAGAMIFQASAPALLSAKQFIDNRPHRFSKAEMDQLVSAAYAKVGLSNWRMKGVPVMRTTPAISVAQPRTTFNRAKQSPTILNEMGRSSVPISAVQRALWRDELASGNLSKNRADTLTLWLAEADLAREYPQTAIGRIDTLLRRSPTSAIKGLAKHDRAEALFYMGRYTEARKAFEAELRGKDIGFDRREAALWARHARGCEGYHLENERLGVPIPLRLDPMCGVAALATCLRSHGLPYDKAQLAKVVRHTGEGSNLEDLVAACDSLGVSANPVQSSEKGLQNLPLPVVAHVEGDHFVAVVATDAKGVEYVCSDCGVWPGGPVRVSWKAWRAMRPGVYMTVTKQGSSEQEAIDRVAPRAKSFSESKSAAVAISTGVTQGRLAGAASKLAAALIGNVTTLYGAPYYNCGSRAVSLHCPDSDASVGPCCPTHDSSSRAMNGGPGDGDPVNLATGELEYKPAPDLKVYNPEGPSISWSRIYNSMSNVECGFGEGWSNNYNLSVEAPYDNVQLPVGIGGEQVAYRGNVVMANGGKVAFSASSRPDSPTASVTCSVSPGVPLMVEWKGDTTAGEDYYVVTFANRSKWITVPRYAIGGSSEYLSRLPIAKLEDRAGNWIGFDYTSGSSLRLSRIYNSSNNNLLSLAYDANMRLVSASDGYGRSVYYHTSTPPALYNQGPLLDQVSQIVATGTQSPPVRYIYGYVATGNTETSNFPALGQISVPSPTGSGMASSSITYNTYNGFVDHEIDANGNRTEFLAQDWDGSSFGGNYSTGNLTTVRVKNSAGTVTRQYTVAYDASMNETGRKNAQGQSVLSRTYGGGGATYHPASLTDGDGRSWSFTYDTFGNPLTVTSPKGTVTTHTRNYANFPLGELTSVQQGNKTPTFYSYYEPSGLLHVIDAPIPGNVGSGATQATTFTYNSKGDVASVSKPGNNFASTLTTSYVYLQGVGHPNQIIDPNGKTTWFVYGDRGNLQDYEDPVGHKLSWDYNIADQVIAAFLSYTTGGPYRTTYCTSHPIYPGGPTTQSFVLDPYLNPSDFINANYGPEGELLSRTGCVEETHLSYDATYRTKTVTDGNGHSTAYSYDASGRMTQIAHPGASGAYGDKVLFTNYDAVGNLLSRTDGNGQITNYSYTDGDGKLTAIEYPGAPSNNVSITYDAYGRSVSSTDAVGTTSQAFDDCDRMLSYTRTYTGLSPKTSTYAYWPDGSRRSMANVAGTWSYEYDSNGRNVSMSSPVGTSYATYLDNGWQASRTLPNGTTTTYAHDPNGLLTGLENKTSGGMTLSSYGSFTYSGGSDLTSLTASVPVAPSQSGTTTFSYDTTDRLTGESSTRLGGYSESHSYDAAGNPTTFRGNTQAFNADNQRSGAGFSYDGNGNPTTYSGVSLTFSPESRLTSLGTSWSAGYCGDGLRAWKQIDTAKTYFLYDKGEPVVELDASGSVRAVNVFAPDGLIARKVGTSVTQYTFDSQGNVAQKLDSNGTLISSSVFDAYGQEAPTSSPSDPFGYEGRWGYYGDRETGLYLCQNRYYDPSGGRWINRDPIGQTGGINLYGYAQQSPTALADPSGTMSLALGSFFGVSAWCGFQFLQAALGYITPEEGCDRCMNALASLLVGAIVTTIGIPLPPIVGGAWLPPLIGPGGGGAAGAGIFLSNQAGSIQWSNCHPDIDNPIIVCIGEILWGTSYWHYEPYYPPKPVPQDEMLPGYEIYPPGSTSGIYV